MKVPYLFLWVIKTKDIAIFVMEYLDIIEDYSFIGKFEFKVIELVPVGSIAIELL